MTRPGTRLAMLHHPSLPVVAALVLTLAVPPGFAAARPAQPQEPRATDEDVPDAGSSALPVSLDRIRRGLERADRHDALVLPDMPIFSVSVERRLPRLDAYYGSGRWTYGPAMPSAMSHREFLEAVTPKDALPYGSFTSGELAQVVATSLGSAYLLQTLTSAIKDAFRKRKEADAKREVQETLDEIERARRAQDRQP